MIYNSLLKYNNKQYSINIPINDMLAAFIIQLFIIINTIIIQTKKYISNKKTTSILNCFFSAHRNITLTI